MVYGLICFPGNFSKSNSTKVSRLPPPRNEKESDLIPEPQLCCYLLQLGLCFSEGARDRSAGRERKEWVSPQNNAGVNREAVHHSANHILGSIQSRQHQGESSKNTQTGTRTHTHTIYPPPTHSSPCPSRSAFSCVYLDRLFVCKSGVQRVLVVKGKRN